MPAKTNKRRPSRWQQIALIAVFSPAILCVCILFVPLLLGYAVVEAVSYRAFCWRNQGRRFLVCSTRHGWKDFISNNLIPMLPEHVNVVWYKKLRRATCRGRFRHVYQRNLPKPYLAFVTRYNIYRVSLNDSLRQLKHRACRDSAVQQQVREAIALKLSEIPLHIKDQHQL